MIRVLGVIALLLASSGCKPNSSSSAEPTSVEPRGPETLSELAVFADFDFALTRSVALEVEIQNGDSGILVVQEPGHATYDPRHALSKGVVSATDHFEVALRVDTNATEIPVFLYRHDAFESAAAAIDLDGTARVVFP